MNQLYKSLFLFIKKRVNNQEDAEDLTQEVFYKLSKSKTESVDDIKSWLFTIAKNTITDYYRKKKIYTEELNHKLAQSENEDKATANELSECIRVFIGMLPKDYRSIITLSELERVSQKEIAERLNVNYATVRSKIQRGRKKVKDLFSEYCVVTQGGKGSIIDCMPRQSYNENIPCSC